MDLTPDEPRNLRREAKRRWDRFFVYEGEREIEDDRLFQFEGRHDLARAMRGISLPSVLVVREGCNAWISTEAWSRDFPLNSVLSGVEAIGDVIANHVSASSSDRAQRAARAWADRGVVADHQKLISLATGSHNRGLPPEARRLQYWELNEAANADSELAAAARFVPGGTTSATDLLQILDKIRGVGPVNTTALDALGLRLRRRYGSMSAKMDTYRATR
jgi:hypothetical protein